MAIDLHERLSEFSYGYGVTRETEALLTQVGLRAVPFLPSLLHEAELGFDVAFDKPGAALMLQFKLGQSLTKFYGKPHLPKSLLNRPFWRYHIDTAEPDGQFETLLKADADGADVYYVAPRFSDWPYYARLFEDGEILDNSLLVRPSDIRSALDAQGAVDGSHRIVYDRYRVHVCSEPTRMVETDADEIPTKIAYRVREQRRPMRDLIETVFAGFDERASIRRDRIIDADYSASDLADQIEFRASGGYARTQRRNRVDRLRERAKSREHAVAAAVGIELWTMGIQLVLATED